MKEIDPVAHLLPLKRRIFGLTLSLVGSREEAEDITGEVLLRLWERRAEVEIENLEAYALAAARHLAIDHLRRHSRSATQSLDEMPHLGDIPGADVPPDARAEPRDTLECVEHLLLSLPAKQRLVLRLRDVEELSYAEIARIAGLSLADVKVSLLRARRRLRESYENLHNDGL